MFHLHRRNPKMSHSFLREINPVIRFMIISDTVFMSAAGLLGPIFALFIEGFIVGGNEMVAGLAAAIYLLTKSIFQIPVARMIDRIKGDQDDFWIMFVFSLCISLIPLFYLVVHTPMQLYIVQFFLGIFTAFTFPTYMALFTRHIDKNKEGTEWGIYFTLVDLTGALFAAIGGYVALKSGFHSLILLVVVLSTLGTLLLLPISPYIRSKKQISNAPPTG